MNKIKRVGYIYEKIYDIKNVYEAIHKALKGKKKHMTVKKVLNNIDIYVLRIQEMVNRYYYRQSNWATHWLLYQSVVCHFYLEGLDHYINQQLEVKYYVRYVDDLVL